MSFDTRLPELTRYHALYFRCRGGYYDVETNMLALERMERVSESPLDVGLDLCWIILARNRDPWVVVEPLMLR